MIRWEPIVSPASTPTNGTAARGNTHAFDPFASANDAAPCPSDAATVAPRDGDAGSSESALPDASVCGWWSGLPGLRPDLSPLAQGADAIDLPLKLELRVAGGTIEIIDVPWRLSATGQLAQSIGRPVGLDATAVAGTLRAPDAMHSAGGLPFAPRTMAYATTQAREASLTAAALAGVASTRAAVGVDDAGLPETVAATTATADWVERLMRWIERHGRGTVFIRDYRLDHVAADRIGEQLRALADTHGIALERVTVNGRAVWQAPAEARENTHAR